MKTASFMTLELADLVPHNTAFTSIVNRLRILLIGDRFAAGLDRIVSWRGKITRRLFTGVK